MRRSVLNRLAVVLALGLMLSSLTGCVACACPWLSRSSRSTPVPQIAPMQALPTPLAPDLVAEADAEELLLINLYSRANPAVVHIRVAKRIASEDLEIPTMPWQEDLPDEDFYQRGTGSGFLIDRDGHIVTNNHVVEGAEEVQILFFDGTTVRADILGTDADSDLAVVQADIPGHLGAIEPLQLGDSDTLQIGQRAIALGNPFGLRGTLTTGIVSALGRSLPLGRASVAIGARFSIPELIQTDAAINPGNSGGPLLDSKGLVIGVNTAYDPEAFGVGFAVPANTVKRVIPRLIEEGRYPYPWLGISGTDLSIEIVEEMDLPVQSGAIVTGVTPNSPADRAGIRGSDENVERLGREFPVGGDVIVAIDDQEVRQFEDLLVYILRSTEVGQKVTLSIIREGQERTITVQLGERPSD